MAEYVLILIGLVVTVKLARWAFLPARYLPGNRARTLRLRLFLRLTLKRTFTAGCSSTGQSRSNGDRIVTERMTGQPQTTAQEVVTSLALPPAEPAPSQPPSPLPLTGLHRLPRDASMLYDIGRVDSSGRVASNDVIDALHWHPGSKLEIILTPRTIVIRAASGGPFSVPRRPCILIPSHARRPHGIKPGDHVLVAAAPDYGLVIVYPLSALEEIGYDGFIWTHHDAFIWTHPGIPVTP